MSGIREGKLLTRLTLAGLAALLVACTSYAQEHPKQEHPTEAGKRAVSLEDVASAIQAYVDRDAKLKGGFFLVYDGAAKSPLALTLVQVHKGRLSKVGDQTYFACADFQRVDGKKVYDLDVFMQGPDKDHLEATQVLIHKEGGKERYTWYEEGGVWKRREAGKP